MSHDRDRTASLRNSRLDRNATPATTAPVATTARDVCRVTDKSHHAPNLPLRPRRLGGGGGVRRSSLTIAGTTMLIAAIVTNPMKIGTTAFRFASWAT